MIGVIAWAQRMALIALALATAYYYAQWQAERAAHATTHTAHATAALQSATAAAATTAQLQKDKDHAIDQANTRANSNRADATSARTQLDSLRHTIAATRALDPSANTCTPAPDRTDPLPELFGECAGALTDLAEKADRINNDRLTLLASWPTLSPAPVTPD